MIPFGQAFEIVINSSYLTGKERVQLAVSSGRYLAEDVVSDIDMPPFNKASMDGFACRRSDLGAGLEIIETIQAGQWPEKRIGPLQCSRIMTGAPVPEGADCVIIKEEAQVSVENKVRFTGTFTRDNISLKGEDVRKNDIVQRTGRMIEPQDIAVMAAVGYISPLVRKKPLVGVISTGSEIVEPDQSPGLSEIRNSNAAQLAAQVERAGAKGKYYGIARDNEDETLLIVKSALSECDIVLITGGVSMGDFDFVPAVLERAGVNILFTRVAVQPGKPTTFGQMDKRLVFGLPGNPVSAFIQFELLVRPLIGRMMGAVHKSLRIILPMREKYTRRSADRMGIIPVVINEEGKVIAAEYHGSAHISALTLADGIISINAGQNTIAEGEMVEVRLI